MRKLIMNKQDRTPWMSLMKNEILQQLSRLSISKTCDDTTVDASRARPFKKGISAPPDTKKEKDAQVIPTLGRAVCGKQEFIQWILLLG